MNLRLPLPLRLALLAAGALLLACSPPPTKDDQRARAIERSFLGGFVGTLERRDPASGRQITLPTTMRGSRQDDDRIKLEFEHDEGDGRITREATFLEVKGESRELILSSADGALFERYRIEGYAAFTGLGELIVTGSAVEEGKPIDVRILYSVAPDRITWTKDTRPPGGAFQLRQRYTMKRSRGTP